MTKYAKRILELIDQSDQHMTAEQLFFELKKTEPRVVQAPVYKKLHTQYQEGLIRKLSIEGKADSYDNIHKHDHHV